MYFVSYTRKQRDRIERGLCIDCDVAVSDGKRRCLEHSQKVNSLNRATYKRMVRDPDKAWRFRKRIATWQKQNPDKVKKAVRTWEAKHRDKVREYGRRYYLRNRNERIAHTKAWRLKHAKQFRAATNRWKISNPHKVKESAAKSAKKNTSKRYAYQRLWVERNREKTRASGRRSYRKRREVICQKLKDKYHANIHESRTKSRNDKLRRSSAPGSHTTKQWLSRVAYYGWKCRWCGKTLTTKTLTKDHVLAISRGGTNFSSNLVPACQSCNSGKGTKRHYTPLP